MPSSAQGNEIQKRILFQFRNSEYSNNYGILFWHRAVGILKLKIVLVSNLCNQSSKGICHPEDDLTYFQV